MEKWDDVTEFSGGTFYGIGGLIITFAPQQLMSEESGER